MGWFGAVVFALHFHALPGIVLIIGSILCGALCGAIWSGIAGVLRAFFGTSEVISTIMLNYIALYYVNHAIKTWLAPKGSDSSPNIPKKASLCTDFLQNLTHGSTFHWGFFLAILCAFAVWFYFNKTCSGFEVRSVGMNPSASRYAGMNVKKTIIVAMIISGILAGLAGAPTASATIKTFPFQTLRQASALTEWPWLCLPVKIRSACCFRPCSSQRFRLAG